jgi:hypothetical protein
LEKASECHSGVQYSIPAFNTDALVSGADLDRKLLISAVFDVAQFSCEGLILRIPRYLKSIGLL